MYPSKNKRLAGFCGGIAEYLNTNPTIVRVIWLIVSLAYLIALIVLPQNPN